MRLTQLIYFRTVVEEGTVKRAAKKLFVSSPAVSIAIGNLEEELKTELFEHTGNRITLTKKGKTYFDRICPILDQLAAVTKEVCGEKADAFRMTARQASPRKQKKPPIPRRERPQIPIIKEIDWDEEF